MSFLTLCGMKGDNPVNLFDGVACHGRDWDEPGRGSLVGVGVCVVVVRQFVKLFGYFASRMTVFLFDLAS